MVLSVGLGDLTGDGIRKLHGVGRHPVELREDAVVARIALYGETRKVLGERLRQAFASHATRLRASSLQCGRAAVFPLLSGKRRIDEKVRELYGSGGVVDAARDP